MVEATSRAGTRPEARSIISGCGASVTEVRRFFPTGGNYALRYAAAYAHYPMNGPVGTTSPGRVSA